MSLVSLPSSPNPAALAWLPIDFGGVQQSPLGGSAQRVNRLGNRWSAAVTMPPMLPVLAREWSAALTQGVEEGVVWTVRQVGFEPGGSGAELVNGAEQSGKALVCDGAIRSYAARPGQIVSVVTGGNRYCYMIASPSRANAAGNITLNLTTNLRAEPADDDVVEIALPKMEGLLSEVPEWAYDVDRVARGFSFTITEVR